MTGIFESEIRVSKRNQGAKSGCLILIGDAEQWSESRVSDSNDSNQPDAPRSKPGTTRIDHLGARVIAG